MPWLLSRFEIKKFGKTAIQEVITLYSHDFPKDSIYFPLESFQVGQLVRQGKNQYKYIKNLNLIISIVCQEIILSEFN